ncbi:MAG: glycosyltransferase family 4 protein, partial [Burkholderiales bacterium]|nr:glycosyltransferase family 4 protein [Burkholderiales bacterium]
MPAYAALYYQPEGFDTHREKLMGRHAASEGFLKGLVQYGQLDTLYAYTDTREHALHFERLCAGFGNRRPVVWMHSDDPSTPRRAGALHLADPNLVAAAWRRRAVGQRLYSITGVTHTTASAGAMDLLSGLVSAPVQPWDALVCTSTVVRDTVEQVLDAQQDYLASRLGATRFVRPQLALIPLGVDGAAFALDEAVRAAGRRAFGIGPEDVAVLFVGRLSFHGKAHPLPMYLGLQRAAQALPGARLHLVQAGWFANEHIEKAMREGAATLCPDVACHFVDGRKPELRRMAWQAADLFTSLSDNIQETFGLTPVEAMAAGLPGVVSDWNGYRDTLRDGIDGLRVPTVMPRAGLGIDLADRHAAGIDSYDLYCARASQFVAVDMDAAAAAYQRLVTDAALRRQMGAAARQRALAQFDWRVIIARYQALWQQLAEQRQRAAESAPLTDGQTPQPARMDPYRAFASYPSQVLGPAHRVALAPDADAARLQTLLRMPLFSYMQGLAPDADRCAALFAELQRRGPLRVD